MPTQPSANLFSKANKPTYSLQTSSVSRTDERTNLVSCAYSTQTKSCGRLRNFGFRTCGILEFVELQLGWPKKRRSWKCFAPWGCPCYISEGNTACKKLDSWNNILRCRKKHFLLMLTMVYMSISNTAQRAVVIVFVGVRFHPRTGSSSSD